ncbi:hypothetical protein HDU93_008979 [Gonapodya sp. JEL0774]|nr:hypothetical protein HDU93_008979 [Gonapodya sp. JEL0774]
MSGSPSRPRSSSRNVDPPRRGGKLITPAARTTSFDSGHPHHPPIPITNRATTNGSEDGGDWTGSYGSSGSHGARGGDNMVGGARDVPRGRPGRAANHDGSPPDAATAIAEFAPPSLELRPTFNTSGTLGRVADEALPASAQQTPPGLTAMGQPLGNPPVAPAIEPPVSTIPASPFSPTYPPGPGTGNPLVPFGLLVRTQAYEQLAKVQRAITDANELPPERENEKEKRLDETWLELTQLSTAGNVEAQYFLALEFGKDSKWDEALKLFIQASRNGHAPSAYQAGLCFEHRRGYSTPQPALASRLYAQAAELGYLPALYRLVGTSLRPGVASSCMQIAKELERRDDDDVDGDYLGALLETAGEAGYIKAWYRLGQIFERGLYGVVSDPLKAYRFYRKASDRLDPEAMYRLAVVFENGELTALVDGQRALKYYARSAERGDVAAMNRMGEILEKAQLGVIRDIPKALERYEGAARKGSADAMHNLARIKSEGLYGFASSPEQALRVFELAPGEHPDALHALGVIFEKGQYATPVDIDRAIAYHIRAADLGSTKALIRLGRMYELGELGRPKDVNRAASYYRTAAEKGDAKGQFLLAGYYATGVSWLVKESPEQTFKLLKKAVAGGCVEAEYRLGRMYERGGGTPVDKDKAMFLFRQRLHYGSIDTIEKGARERARGLFSVTAAEVAQEEDGLGLEDLGGCTREEGCKMETFLRETVLSCVVTVGATERYHGDVNLERAATKTASNTRVTTRSPNDFKLERRNLSDDVILRLADISSNVLMSDSQRFAMADQQAIMQELARKRRARTLAVPTDDNRVKARLREFGEPICLFAEDPGDRRERLRDIMARKAVQEDQAEDAGRAGRAASAEVESDEEDEQIVEEFYTPGPEELLEARTAIAAYSLPRARARIAEQRAEIEIPFPQRKKVRHEFYTETKTFSIFSSQVADDRPASVCAFAPGSRFFATGGWSGLIKLWTVPGSEKVLIWKGHKDRVSGIAFHPEATLPHHSPKTVSLASCSTDSTILLYSLRQSTPIATLEGHIGRVARVAFHPCGRWLASTGFDTTWRLWDVERQEEMVEQEGHAKEVYAIAFQGDGSLVGTA